MEYAHMVMKILAVCVSINLILRLMTKNATNVVFYCLKRAISFVTEMLGLLLAGERIYAVNIPVMIDEEEKDATREEILESQAYTVLCSMAFMSKDREYFDTLTREVISEAKNTGGRDFIELKSMEELLVVNSDANPFRKKETRKHL